MKKFLVIVESPSKAKTIEKILGKNYEVQASYGHVIDLPSTSLGIDVENDYKPKYITIKGKSEVLKKLKTIAKKSDIVYLASDLDREGEAIAWHISNYIKLPEKMKRIVFNEITDSAVKQAIKNPRDIDIDLVNAQQTRRLLDRIVGYKISPLLWKTVNKNASAGRVQSVALKIICDLEDTIKNFIAEEYREYIVLLENGMELKLSKINNEKIDKIFDKNIKIELSDSLIAKKVKISKKSQKAPLVFKTSTLQQLSASYLGFSASKTMRIAQQLYEGLDIAGQTKGLITYMRTDSTRVSVEAQKSASEYIENKFGKEYVGKYFSKNKNAQDAHEGIRPSYIELEPTKIASYLSKDQLKLYTLIWNRFITSQFADMKYEQLQLTAVDDIYEFTGTSNKIIFDGYYKFQKDEEIIKTQELPEIKENDNLKIRELIEKNGITKPPARYTEASIVKKLETEGIGRPSTYASIIDTLINRNYITIEDKKLIPTILGNIVKKELEENFLDIMNIKFTANMEDTLDAIAEGKENWVSVLDKYYKLLEIEIEKYNKSIKEIKELRIESDILDSQGNKMILKSGRFGKYLVSETNEEEKISLKEIEIDKEELKKGNIVLKDKLNELIEKKKGLLTDYEENGVRFYLKDGRFGSYLESENYEKDNIRIALSSTIKQKLKKNLIAKEENILLISKEINKEKEENNKILSNIDNCEKCGKDFSIKKGRYGKFLACSGYPECKNIKSIKKDK